MASFDINATTKSADKGYILEYPEHLHDSHSDYPLAAEKLRITNEMLSEQTRDFWKIICKPIR